MPGIRLSILLSIIPALLWDSLPAGAIGPTQEMVSACRSIVRAEIKGDHIVLPTTFETGTCWGAFAAIQRAIRYADQEGTFFAVCAPANSRLTQLITIFVTYAEKNPQRLHEEFFDVGIDSLREAFPCEQRRR
jgi:hypothetical protein